MSFSRGGHREVSPWPSETCRGPESNGCQSRDPGKSSKWRGDNELIVRSIAGWDHIGCCFFFERDGGSKLLPGFHPYKSMNYDIIHMMLLNCVEHVFTEPAWSWLNIIQHSILMAPCSIIFLNWAILSTTAAWIQRILLFQVFFSLGLWESARVTSRVGHVHRTKTFSLTGGLCQRSGKATGGRAGFVLAAQEKRRSFGKRWPGSRTFQMN